MTPTMKPYTEKRRQALQGGASPCPPPSNDNCEGGIDSAIGGSLLIDSHLSLDAGDEDGNNIGTPGIQGPTNDDTILIEEKAVDAC